MLVVSVPYFIAMVFTPIVSYKSDRHRGRWGRRIPFLLAPTPIGVAAIAGLAFSPPLGVWLHRILGGKSPGLDVSVLIFLGVFWVVFAFTSQISYALFNALINDVVPREILGRFFAAFRALSLIAGSIFSYFLMGSAGTAYGWIFLGMGIIYGGGFFSMCAKVKEGDYPPAPPAGKRGGIFAFVDAGGSYFKECFDRPYYCWFHAMWGLSWLAFIPINTYSLFYSVDLNMSNKVYGYCIAISYLISVVLAYPLGILADRVHPIRAGIAMMGLFTGAAFFAGAFVHEAKAFGIALVVFTVTSGAWMTTTASIAQRLLPKNKFGQLYSAAIMIQSALIVAVPPLIGVFLDFHHHDYRYVFHITGGIGIAALFCSVMVYVHFMRMGGPKSFVAPE
jgi:MFS family permease